MENTYTIGLFPLPTARNIYIYLDLNYRKKYSLLLYPCRWI